MKEQEEKQSDSNELPEKEASITENNPDEPLSADPKIPKEDKPKHQQESDQQKKFKDIIDQHRSPSPDVIIGKCLNISFTDYDDIKNFCSYHFNSLYKELKESDRFSKAIELLIQHCNKHASMETLWECIKIERKPHYDIYFPKWQEAKNASRNPADQFVDTFESPIRQNPLAPDDAAKDHPLSGSDVAAVNDWFHNELDSQEKSMVLTVALFKGINRKHMASISNEIQRRLFETT
jgi:hypothetical protein